MYMNKLKTQCMTRYHDTLPGSVMLHVSRVPQMYSATFKHFTRHIADGHTHISLLLHAIIQKQRSTLLVMVNRTMNLYQSPLNICPSSVQAVGCTS